MVDHSDAYDIILKEGLDHRVANLGGAIGAGNIMSIAGKLTVNDRNLLCHKFCNISRLCFRGEVDEKNAVCEVPCLLPYQY